MSEFFVRRVFIITFSLMGLATLGSMAVAQPPIPPDAPALPPLANHKALYDVTLFRSRNGVGGPLAANGQIAYGFSGSSCGGYMQNMRQLVEINPAEGNAQITDSHSISFEDAQGKNFRFNVSAPNQTDTGGVDGKAAKAAAGRLTIDIEHPNPLKVNVDQDVMFPTEHTRHVLEAAREGKKILLARIFDGSDNGQKIYDVTAVIGKAHKGPDGDKGTRVPEFAALRYWPVSLSYFDPLGKDNTPTYSIAFDLYENGVSSALRLDYGDFILAGELEELKFSQPEQCH